jgi:hypothetical protein
MLQKVAQLSQKEFDKILNKRKTEITSFILNSLKP